MKFDVSFYCFLFVSLIAIGVASLRTKTIDLGYTIANLKKEEEKLKVNQTLLQLKLEKKKRDLRLKSIDEKEGFALPSLSKIDVTLLKNKNVLE